jgi:predicted acyltransferase
MRYASVDILRGLTVAVMILVNNPGSWSHVYPWLLHAEWHGCLLADLVFPFFLFIVGLSIVFSLSKALTSGADKRALAFKCLKRSLILIALGLFLNLFPDFDIANLRYPGVLQRIGIAFAVGSLLFIYLSENQRRWFSALILIAYWLLLSFVPVPGIGEVSLEKNTNWASWVDQLVLQGHMWKYTYTWDPEGVLSTIPAIVSVLLGISTAVYMMKHRAPVKGLFIYGLAALAIGWGWSLHLPLNKALWTSSFVLYTTGIALCLLSVSVYLFDEKKVNKGTDIFRALGANPLAAYFGAELLVRILNLIQIAEIPFYDYIFEQLTQFIPNNLSSLIMALAMVGLWVSIALTLYKRKIYIKV